jgi:hypothetical protein
MRPYHPSNLSLTPYAPWRVILLAWVGKLLDVQFHVEGIPFGGSYRRDLHPVYNA